MARRTGSSRRSGQGSSPSTQATRSSTKVPALVDVYKNAVELVRPLALRRPIGRDPDDEAVIACALAARADLIVSGDQDLLVLKRYRRIRILNAAEALAIIRSR